MRSLNVLKIFALIAFLCLAGFSCYWTAESLYIWQPSLSIYGAWMIAVVFFVIASICFGLLLRSLDRHADFYGKLGGRGGAFVMAFFGLMLFWLLCSLPTNTHTLLYRAEIKNTLTADLNRTQGYLKDLKDNNVEIKKIDQKYKSKSDAVSALLLRLLAEIEHPGLEGVGPRFNKAVEELDVVLANDSDNPSRLQRVASVGSTPAQWNVTFNFYKAQAFERLKLYRASCDKEIAHIRETMRSKELNALMANNELALKDISQMHQVDNDVVRAALNDLENSYAFIKTNARYIEFKDNDRELYTREGALPESTAMLSVPDVWTDYLTTDKYDGHGFGWWVMIALLVDFAGFIFFNMAFNKKYNNNAIKI